MRVLVVAESAKHGEILRQGALAGGHTVISTLSLDSAPSSVLRRGAIDLLILEAHTPGIALLESVRQQLPPEAAIAVFAGESQPAAVEYYVRAGVVAYVVQGLDAERVPAILEVAFARHKFLSDLRADLDLAQQKLAERKYVERAKGLLMKTRNLSEEEAYHALRRMAMERNRRMGDIARSVLEMAELLS